MGGVLLRLLLLLLSTALRIGQALLVTLPRTKLLHLYEAEVLTTFGSNDRDVHAEKIDSGMWTLACEVGKSEEVLSICRESLTVEAVYDELTDLCRTPEALIDQVQKLNLRLNQKFDIKFKCLHPYQRHQRGFSGPQHLQGDRSINSRMLCVAVGQRIDGMPAFEKDDSSALELFILECGRGFVLAKKLSLPALNQNGLDWETYKATFRRRPFTFSAALNPDIARSVLRTLVSMHDSNRRGLCLLDPCVGSGTTIFAATTCLPKGLVSRTVGCDINDDFLQQAASNLHFMQGSRDAGVTFLLQDATTRLADGERASHDRAEVDLVIANFPWGENKSISYFEDTHRIVETLGSTSGTYHYVCNPGACAAFITSHSTRIPGTVYNKAGWVVEQVVTVGSADKDRDVVVVTFARLT